MFKVEKRNGEFVDFNKQKIIDAINAAFIEVDGTLYEEDTAKDIRYGIFAFTIPVITSVDGLCVATIKCIPAARAI